MMVTLFVVRTLYKQVCLHSLSAVFVVFCMYFIVHDAFCYREY